MIKGSLKDASIPGLVQFLANEVDKNYRVKVERGSFQGDIIVNNGNVVSANYGLLRGEDAMCEFLTWEEGVFSVERLPARLDAVFFEKNIQIRLHQGDSFADQASFLLCNNIGLNTIVRSSKMFGTPEWQESSRLHPLQREDFLILGWLSGGRTMRQSMREFAFDILQATAILYRLVLTRSVEVVPLVEEVEPQLEESPIEPLSPIAPAPQVKPVSVLDALKASAEVVVSMPARPAPPVVAQPEVSAVAPTAPPEPVMRTDRARQIDNAKTLEPEPSAAVPKVEPLARPLPSSPASIDRRTTVLPIISIDIERLMKAIFTITEFGFLALKNPALDEGIRLILIDAESGMSIESVVAKHNRPPSNLLSTFRYCMDRGYLVNPDSVLPLTADLLLGRTELDQYLLQRRRVTGEVLRDLSSSSHGESAKLYEQLIKSGFLSQEDLDTYSREHARFAMH